MAREKPVAGRASEQGSMYHIWAAQCQIQLSAGKCIHHCHARGTFSQAAARRRRYLSRAFRAGIGGMQQRHDPFTRKGSFDRGRPDDDPSRLAGDPQRIKDGSLEEAFDFVGKVR